MGLYVEEFEIGQRIVTPGRTIGEGDIMLFAGMTSDFTPIHVDAHFATQHPFGERIAHGTLTMSVAIGLLTQMNLLGDKVIALLNLNWDFSGPVKIGDTIYAQIVPIEARKSSRPGAGVVRFQFTVVNQRDETVQSGVMTTLMKTKPA